MNFEQVAIAKAITAAFNEGNAAVFSEFLTRYPEFLRNKDGTDRWMWQAAMDGHLSILQCLVRLGQNVNETNEVRDPDDIDCLLCQVEGPILQASGEGHLDIVRWLLTEGATINFDISGNRRCLPLLRAATNGHLDVVRLLVEHGAIVNFTFNGHTPLSQAISYGNDDVAEYLRSVGAVG